MVTKPLLFLPAIPAPDSVDYAVIHRLFGIYDGITALLDQKDRQILRELLADGRASWVELGERVSLSPAATQRRVEALRAAGVIQGFTARVDLATLGCEVEAYVEVSVERHDIANAQRFRDVIKRYPEVQTCHMMSGEVDYLLRVVT
ncbi:MAG: Lrp/AsnC family transcriptional regulator, partial [Woeseia sp.]|nr:Lrp/AsnC family transcriptional regulator [Woeseia sp.]